MTSPVTVGIDAGTTGTRAIAVDHDGRIVGSAYREFTQHFPRPGWVEHDPVEIWDATEAVLSDVVATLEGPPAAIGITNQRETVVAWDRRTGEVRHRAIVWQDRRTASRCDELTTAGHLPRVRELTGLVLDPYFTATKARWLLDHGVADDDDLALGTIDSWVLWNLTGGHHGGVFATDPSNASRTLLFDIGRREWSDELCSIFGVPRRALAEVLPSCGRFGTTAPGCAAGGGIPVSGIAGDQQAALFGQACFEPGMTKNTYGTGSFVLMNVGDTCPPPTEGLLTTVAWTLPAELTGGAPGAAPVTSYALEGSIFVTGAAVQWLRDGLGIIEDAAEVGPLAESVPDTGGVVLVPAFAGLGSPWWDPYARGTLIGLTRGTNRAHLARATVESMALQTRDVVEAMVAAAGTALTELRVDGGASVMPLLRSLQADHLGVPVVRPTSEETTALGAAFLAGLAEGVWDGLDDVAHRWQEQSRTEPDSTDARRDDLDAANARWRRAVERSRSWAT